MNKQDLEKFFNRLEELLETNGCNAANLANAQIILKEMSSPQKEQKEFLENC